jgi:hypothetical protein
MRDLRTGGLQAVFVKSAKEPEDLDASRMTGGGIADLPGGIKSAFKFTIENGEIYFSWG